MAVTRLAMSIIYPGCDWNGRVFNSLDKKIDGSDNADYPTNADNASKTGLSWLKYLGPKSQYADMWDANCCPIVLRYADVLLTWAECENELNGPSAEVYKKINQVRNRAGMPNVDGLSTTPRRSCVSSYVVSVEVSLQAKASAVGTSCAGQRVTARW